MSVQSKLATVDEGPERSISPVQDVGNQITVAQYIIWSRLLVVDDDDACEDRANVNTCEGFGREEQSRTSFDRPLLRKVEWVWSGSVGEAEGSAHARSTPMCDP